MTKKLLICALSLGIAVLVPVSLAQTKDRAGDKFDKAGKATKDALKTGGKGLEKGLDAIGTGVKATVDHTGGRDTNAGESSKAALGKAGDGADTGLGTAGKGLGAAVEHTGRGTTDAGKATAGAMKKTGQAVAGFFGGDDKDSGSAAARNDRTRAMQRALKSKGFYGGAIDGIAGPQTQSGLREFQGDNGLGKSGKLDAATAKKLGLE
jgi:hypothetical protein